MAVRVFSSVLTVIKSISESTLEVEKYYSKLYHADFAFQCLKVLLIYPVEWESQNVSKFLNFFTFTNCKRQFKYYWL